MEGEESWEGSVAVVEVATGKVLKGEEAPTPANLQAWLDSHPGWEPYDSDSEDSGSDSGGADDDEDSQSKPTNLSGKLFYDLN